MTTPAASRAAYFHGVAFFDGPQRRNLISYSVYPDPNEALAAFEEHQTGHVLDEFAPQLRNPSGLEYLGSADVGVRSFCAEIELEVECAAVIDHVTILSHAGYFSGSPSEALERAKTLLRGGIEHLESL